MSGLDKELLLSLDHDFSNLIMERVSKARDIKAEKMLDSICESIQEYKSIEKTNSIKHYDKLADAINDLLIYY